MKAIRFKEFRLYTSFDRALWCALIWPFILALNPLFLEAGESLSTAMIDAPGFALLFSLCVDYTTYDDYRSGVFELIVRAGLPLREYPTAKLWFYEAVSSAFLLVSLVAGLAVDHWRPSDMPVTVMRLFMAFVLNGAWAALGTRLAICLRLLNPDSALYLTPLALALPVFANVALWHLVDPVLALTVSSIVAALCGAGAFAITARVLRGGFIPTLRSDAGRYGHGMALEDMSVAVEHVTFGYGRRQTVLDDVSFTVPQGQSVAILGYNGVGKTTLFKLITGLLRPRSGRCVINGMLVPSMRDVFLMTEHANLISAMSVRDNIRFRGLLFDPDGTGGMDPSRLGGEPLVRAFELGPFLDTRVSRLSSGMRGRAGLVAGMLFDPHVIMLDEPTNSIDPITRDLLIDYVNRLHACGRTILTVTHDLEYCWKTMDRAVILGDRRIAGDVMLADIPDYETFTHIATLGHGRRTVDFGLERQMARSEE